MNEHSPFALEVEHLMVNYERNCVLFDLSLKIPAGHLVAILGPNGAGKSTFIKSVLGFITPISGIIRFLGKGLKERKKRISYIPQVDSLDWQFPLTVLDLVLMGAYGRTGLLKWVAKEDRFEAERLLAKVGLEGYGNRQINQLSGGQKQRLFIARALMQKAEIYFMDEPFSGVDLFSQEVIGSILKELRDQGKTIFVVHHGLEQVAELFDWVILLHRSLVAYGPVENVFVPETIKRAFGTSSLLFDEVSRLVHNVGERT